MHQENMWKQPVMRPCVSILLIALLFGISTLLAGCGGSVSTPTPEAAAGPLIGESVKLGDVELKVSTITRSVGDQISRTKRGRTWALVTVVVQNNGTEAVEVDPTAFTVTTSSGETALADPDIRFLPMLKATQAGPGKKVEGKMGFDVPDKDELELHWAPAWSDKSVTIVLKKPQ